MDELKNSLLSKREEALARMKQAEADLYFWQGYLKSLDDLLNPPKDALTLDDVKELTGAQSVEIVEKEGD